MDVEHKLLGTIIKHVFNFLDLADLKHCRLVSKKWNALVIPLVKKMSITIIGSPFPPAVPSRSLTSFNKVSENPMITYQSFKLNSSPGCTFWWSFSALEDFLRRQDVRELTIDNINILCPINRPGAFLINRFLYNNLTHLAISNTRSSGSFSVSNVNLIGIKSLSFQNCRLDIVKNCLMAPQKFEMVDVAIFKEKWFVDSIFVNDILSFDNLKELKLSSKAGHFSKLSINLASDITVDNLFLDDGVDVQNFYESKWCITKKLTLRKIPFIKPTLIQFTELDFMGLTSDFNALPESIEKLTLDVTGGNMHMTDITVTQQPGGLALGNLKYLELVTDNHSWCWYCPQVLNLFGSCLNLSTVKLQVKRWEEDYLILNTTWIPRSVRNIFLAGDIRACGVILKLEQLVIQDNPAIYSVTDTLDSLQSKHIVLDFQEMNMTKLEKLVMFLNKRSHYESAAIGFLNGDMQNFKNSCLSQYVDKESHYYLFKNRRGKGIQEEEYANLLKLQ